MAGFAHNAHQDFWRPPLAAVPEIIHPDVNEACHRCGTEFIVGARYCHHCGASRPETAAASGFDVTQIGSLFGLSTGAFIAFLVGIACLLGVLSVGYIFSAKTLVDWQAVQMWRIEWLLGAIAAFVAGCLLKSNH